MSFPGEVVDALDRERGALLEARDLAVRVFGSGATVRIERESLGRGYRGRVYDGASRVRILVEGWTSFEAVREVVGVLEASAEERS